jgi:hypothetical protein
MAHEGETSSMEAKAIVQALQSPLVLKAFENMLAPRFKEISDNVNKTVNEALTPIKEKIEALEITSTSNHTQVQEELEKLRNKQEEIDNKLKILDRNSRASNLKFYGVPLKPHDGGNLESSYVNSLLDVFTEAGIQDISDRDFSRVTKVTPPGQSSFLIVRMSSEQSKKKLYSQRTKLKNCVSKIFMNEDLTREDTAIHKKARKDVKDGLLHSCWTQGGLVYAKTSPEEKPFQVKNI